MERDSGALLASFRQGQGGESGVTLGPRSQVVRAAAKAVAGDCQDVSLDVCVTGMATELVCRETVVILPNLRCVFEEQIRPRQILLCDECLR